MKKYLILVALTTCLLLTGCVTRTTVYLDEKNVKTEEEIMLLIEQVIYDETGDEVSISLKSKENLSVCTVMAIDHSCMKYSDVKGAYDYIFDVVNSKNENIFGTATYSDPWMEKNKKTDYVYTYEEKYDIGDYKRNKDIYNSN